MNRSIITASLLLFILFTLSCGKEGNQGTTADKLKDAASMGTQKPGVAAPSAPTGVSTLSSDGRITITWNKVDGAASYNVYFGASSKVTPQNGTKAGSIRETTYAHTGLKNHSMYYYIVTAANASEESPPSAEMGAMPRGAIPAVPTGVAASGGDGKITVKWNPVQGATSYTVYAATAPGIAKAKGRRIAGVKTTTFQDTNVKKKTMYFYVVTASNGEGESSASGETGAMP